MCVDEFAIPLFSRGRNQGASVLLSNILVSKKAITFVGFELRRGAFHCQESVSLAWFDSYVEKNSYILRHISGQGPVVLALARDSIMQVPEERRMGCTVCVCVCVCVDPLSIF